MTAHVGRVQDPPLLPLRHFADLRAKTRRSANRSTARKNVAPRVFVCRCSSWVPVTHASVTPLRDVFPADADRAARKVRLHSMFPPESMCQVTKFAPSDGTLVRGRAALTRESSTHSSAIQPVKPASPWKRDALHKSRSAAPGWQGATKHMDICERGATPPAGCPARNRVTYYVPGLASVSAAPAN